MIYGSNELYAAMRQRRDRLPRAHPADGYGGPGGRPPGRGGEGGGAHAGGARAARFAAARAHRRIHSNGHSPASRGRFVSRGGVCLSMTAAGARGPAGDAAKARPRREA